MVRSLIVEADGGSRGNPGPAGYGALVRDATTGTVLAERARYLGVVSNNVAEYSGLVAGLKAARGIDPEARVLVRMDSKLVVEQMSGRWKIKHDDMRRLAAEAALVLPPSQVSYEWVPRADNSAADKLANEAMDTGGQIARDYPDPAVGEAHDDQSRGEDQGRRAEETSGAVDSSARPATDDAAAFDTPSRPSGARARFDGAEPLTVVLVRHGQTPLTVAGAYSGSSVPGPSLTARGRVQAAQAADLVYRIGRDRWTDLPRPTAIVASPMVRAQETARAVGRRLGLHVGSDDRFAEVHFGEWEGLTAPQIAERWDGHPERWLTSGTEVAPGGESMADVGDRVWAGLQDLLARGTGRTVVVVGHAVQVRAAVGRAIEAPPSRWAGFRVPPGSVSILRLWADGATELTVVGCPSEP
ncbi:bifunctional RNase H/acid phosphatase [Oerskovia enterophila]|uniref:Phosphoserine phosphatase 1 n=1 Tax=Oerskovia enterophila TaxID=43678 RepID=A0A163R9M0_9CELL|nr:bifunctional RNase H/acid phosphatase [Oerskovia enterophila]KZM34984.1 phosphoserine phosphatase 1 [Oerskovia enterophila]